MDINRSADILQEIIEKEKGNDTKEVYNIKMSKVMVQRVKAYEI